MKQFIRHKSIPYILAFGIPLLFCMLICVVNGVYPFGENCILHVDMYHQYCPFFTEFRNKLIHGGSLQYSWNLGMGSDFVSLYAYYLASPLNFLIVLCSKDHIIEFMTILIVGKIAWSGLSFFLYLKHHYRFVETNGKLDRKQYFPALIFSTAYALSGFVAAYSWDIMWLDCIALFPLIMVGLERLVQEKKPGVYCMTLALSIFSNYYISIMICIFLVFYFLLLFVQQKNGKISALLRFFWYSLLAGGMSAVLLLPEIAVLSKSGSAGESFPETMTWYFNILAEYGRGAVTAETYTGNDHWPNLYAGIFTLLLVWIYLLNRKISWKEKLPRIAMTAFFLISFANNKLDYIWHGMHFPQALPGRQSFLYIFLLLSMGYAAVKNWKGITNLHIIIATVATLLLFYASYLSGDTNITRPSAIMISGLFAGIYGILMLLMKMTGKKSQKLLYQFVCLIALAELGINMGVTGFYTTSRVAYTDKSVFYPRLLDAAQKDAGNEVFYRVEDNGRKTKNDDAMYGYPSVTIFSSLMNLDVSHLFQSMGMEGGKNFYSYNGANPLSSAMLSVRYFLSTNQMEESSVRTLVAECNGNYLYKNRYCLPLGYMMSEQSVSLWNPSSMGRVDSMNRLAKVLGAEGDLLFPAICTVDAGMGDTEINVSEDGYYFADCSECASDSLTVTRNDGWTKQYSKTSHRYLLELGECKADTEIKITNAGAETLHFQVYRLNLRALEQAYDKLNEQTMELEKMTDRSIQGTVEVKKEGRLVLAVPADDGWKLYVDGKPKKIKPYCEALIGVHLKEGTHDIRLEYTTPGLETGAKISVICLTLFILSMLGNKRRRLCQKVERK